MNLYTMNRDLRPQHETFTLSEHKKCSDKWVALKKLDSVVKNKDLIPFPIIAKLF